MRNTLLMAFLILPLLFSCSNDENSLSSLIDGGKYSEALAAADVILSEKLDEEALYTKLVSQLRMGMLRDAGKTASLYVMLFDENEEHLERALSAVIHFSGNDGFAAAAGERLSKLRPLGKSESMALFLRCIELGRIPDAEMIYRNIRSELSESENAYMLLRMEENPSLVLASLESLYGEQGSSAVYLRILREALRVFSMNGWGEMILPLAAQTYRGDPDIAIAIGDIYYSMKNYPAAADWWREAAEVRPSDWRMRMRLLGVNG